MTKDDSPVSDSRLARAKASLIGANFFVETNRFEPLMAVYLIEFKNWDVVWVGYVSIIMNILMLVLQTPAGDLMDKTNHKRLITAIAVLTASITTVSVAWKSDLWFILIMKALEGVAATIFLPALMSLLLGICESPEVPRMVSLTETSNKIGSILFTAGCGVLSYYAYPDVSFLFYLLGAGGLVATLFILAIPDDAIDDERARAGNTKSEDELIQDAAAQLSSGDRREEFANQSRATRRSVRGSVRSSIEVVQEKHSRYRDLLQDRNVAMFAVLTLLFHLFNAGVLPLLAQLIAQEDIRTGLAFTSGSMCITYIVQAPVSFIIGKNYKRFGYKNILMLGLAILPLRCLNLALFAMYWPNQYALAATQIWEGVGSGIYDTLLPLIVKALVDGSGRFGFTFGFIVTCWRVGHGLSILVGEAILKAAHHRYEVPFFFSMAGGIAVCALLAFGVHIPNPPDDDDADENDAKKKCDIELGATTPLDLSDTTQALDISDTTQALDLSDSTQVSPRKPSDCDVVLQALSGDELSWLDGVRPNKVNGPTKTIALDQI